MSSLKDADVSIRRRALDLIYALVNAQNVRILVRELLNFLLVSDVQVTFSLSFLNPFPCRFSKSMF